MRMKKVLSIIVLSLISVMGFAQELDCNVQINSDQIEGRNKSMFNTLQQAISDFLNNRRWTDMTIAGTNRM